MKILFRFLQKGIIFTVPLCTDDNDLDPLPLESSIYRDSGHTNYQIEDVLPETEQVGLMTGRK